MAAVVSEVVMVPVADIQEDPHNLRRKVDADKEAFADLVRSVKGLGIQIPLILRRVEGGYMVVAGHRRLAAAKQVGLSEVPGDVREMSDEDVVEMQLVENLRRADLDPVEEASGYFRLVEMGRTKKQLAERVGRSQSHVATCLKLLEVPKEVLAMLKAGKITRTTALQCHGLEGDLRDRVVSEVVRFGEGANVEWIIRQEKAEAEHREALEKLLKKATSLTKGRDVEAYGEVPVVEVGYSMYGEETRGWKPLADLNLTEEQLQQHRMEGPHAFAVQRLQLVECSTKLAATKKVLGLKTTLTDAQLAERQARREAREKKALVWDTCNDAVTRARMPVAAADVDSIARRMLVAQVWDVVAKEAVKLLGLEPDGGYRGDHAALLKYCEDHGVTGERRVAFAIHLGEKIANGKIDDLERELVELGVMNA